MNMAPGNILIIDDTPANLDVLTKFLTDSGHKVRPAISGEIGLKAAAKAQPDVILLDIQMPGLNGFEVCERLKADPATQRIPVIFISALDALDDKVRAFKVGGVDYITKPFQVLEVLARVESQLSIQWQRRRIEALSAFKDELIGIVSHDLKNPLSVILGYTEMMQFDAARGTPMSMETISRIQKAGLSMLSLIHDLLDNAPNEQRIPLRFAHVSLQEVVNEQVDTFALAAGAKQMVLEKQFMREHLLVNIDSRRFSQVVSNLISNAIKYSPPRRSVMVKVWREEGTAIVEVEDNGFGIPADDLPHVFEKFYRVNTVQHMAANGNGLGLPIAKMIVEQHGGTLTVASEEGVGSVFRITLPLTSTG